MTSRGDAKLGEDLVQVILDGARADEQLGGDRRVRLTFAGEPRDLGLLRSQLRDRLDIPLANALPGRGELACTA